ncbi:Mrp/NBP35 family ATP-binding protein [Haladaptatus sp. NG-SE-30]
MERETTATTDRERAVFEAIRGANVGEEELYVGLADIDGLGQISLEGRRATVSVTLPIPSEEVRSSLEDGIRTAVLQLDDISELVVEWRPEVTDSGARIDVLPDVKNVIAVSSGKGGVGKSTVAVNLAAALADAGASVGLLDADIYGPNAPVMLGCSDTTPATTTGDDIVPREAHGVKVMSMDFVVGENDPIIWRGPMVDDVIKQLVADVAWGTLDYLIVDLPPGTGDAQLTLVQHLPVSGAVIVTTPQTVAVDDARRGLEQFARYDVPILGIVENMSYFRCPDSGSTHEIFGAGGGDQLEDEFDVPVLGHVPIDPTVGMVPEDDSKDDDSSGISIPLVGRLALPRTREEREGTGAVPAVVQDSRQESGIVLRNVATRAAARVVHFHTAFDDHDHDVSHGHDHQHDHDD